MPPRVSPRTLAAARPAAFALALVLAAWGPPVQAAQQATLTLNWLPGGAHVPLYYAQSAGHFRRAGLEVKILSARGSREALQALHRGSAQFALAEAAEVYALRGAGIHLVAVMAYFSRGAGALIALRRPDLQRLADLTGKRIGGPPSSFARLLFAELRPAPPFGPGKVQWEDLAPHQLLPALIEGRVDAVAASSLAAHQYRDAAKAAGKEIALFPYAEAGVNPYGLVLVTTEAQIAQDAARVKAFAGAVAQAAADALGRPQDALDAFLKVNPALGPERNGAEWREAMGLIYPPEARRAGLGRFEEERLRHFQSLMGKLPLAKPSAPLTGVFTSQFLPLLRP
ncbi:MAG: ABC transporter substrate-binding protein [Nitrospinota bacterium]